MPVKRTRGAAAAAPIRPRRAAGLLAGLAAAAFFCACGAASPCGPREAVVSRVVDGDTLVLEGGERVRLLMIDAPEDTGGRSECWGAEATAWHRALAEGRRVSLAYDPTECRDGYGRLLAFVRAGGHELNETLVREGHACVLFVPPSGADRREAFEALERAAREAGRGLWSACARVPCG